MSSRTTPHERALADPILAPYVSAARYEAVPLGSEPEWIMTIMTQVDPRNQGMFGKPMVVLSATNDVAQAAPVPHSEVLILCVDAAGSDMSIGHLVAASATSRYETCQE